MNNTDAKILEIIQNEKFIAFFDFSKINQSGDSEIDGLCKVAMPGKVGDLDYIALTFIFDTQTEGKLALAKRIMASMKLDDFKKQLKGASALTSVPASALKSENYVHQLDIIFSSSVGADVREAVNKVVYVIRTVAGLNTEPPQWWNENNSPAPTEIEKSTWADRIKAYLGLEK